MNTNQLRDASEVALAAYGQFSASGTPPTEDLTILNGDDAGFAEAQALRFRERFDAEVPTFNDASSPGGSGSTSFDATVFIGKDSNRWQGGQADAGDGGDGGSQNGAAAGD